VCLGIGIEDKASLSLLVFLGQEEKGRLLQAGRLP
jgi:hypothetical protein